MVIFFLDYLFKSIFEVQMYLCMYSEPVLTYHSFCYPTMVFQNRWSLKTGFIAFILVICYNDLKYNYDGI